MMKTIRVHANSPLKLFVKISSEAVVGSYVSLDDQVVKRSGLYDFNVDLGNSNDIAGSQLSGASNFFVALGDADAIRKQTKVLYVLKWAEAEEEFGGDVVKINDSIFMAYFVVKLINS
ncbi:hypothetical protein [Sinomicrobium oceani]|uniref:hypothetical protein n=1 Tax=Sinomicrobium oceani TaxID=1150368 RepID=UPI00227BE5A7|nr:hypothetical protein [Sinomicrobium oceani]